MWLKQASPDLFPKKEVDNALDSLHELIDRLEELESELTPTAAVELSGIAERLHDGFVQIDTACGDLYDVLSAKEQI